MRKDVVERHFLRTQFYGAITYIVSLDFTRYAYPRVNKCLTLVYPKGIGKRTFYEYQINHLNFVDCLSVIHVYILQTFSWDIHQNSTLALIRGFFVKYVPDYCGLIKSSINLMNFVIFTTP